MKKLKALQSFLFEDKVLVKGDVVETNNERAASLVKQGVAEYSGDLPVVDTMALAHLEPEPEPLPPVHADPEKAAEAKAKAEKEAKHKPEPHKGHH